MLVVKEINRSTYWLWAVGEAVAVTGAFLLTFVLQQSQFATVLFWAAVLSCVARGIAFPVRKR